MFRRSSDAFHLSDETRESLKEHTHIHDGKVDADLTDVGKHILQAAKDYKAQTDWSGFKPGPPTLCTKHMYQTSDDKWVQEKVLVEIDSEPFGRGALRECFRMREVQMRDHSIDDASGAEHASPRDMVLALAQIHNSNQRRCWVAKRSMSGHADLSNHRDDCLADAALQQVAKHYAELFNLAMRPKRGETKSTCHVHEVDFLMAHVIELPDGSTYGVEAYVFGQYEKYNNNSGGVIRPLDWVTPQAFSYFTFVHSGHRLMIVDIQGVDDLFTDPVLHFLPEHNSSLAALGDQSVNLGIRGMALFLWSHRNNPVDRMLDLPAFQHAPAEQRSIDGIAGLTVARLATQPVREIPRKSELLDLGRELSRSNSEPVSTRGAKVLLASITGIDLSMQAWSNVSVVVTEMSIPLHLVVAACHMEIAIMYHEGRIGEADKLTHSEAEAAVFHLVLAAKEGLPEAMLGLARICSGMSHDDFLPTVHSGPEHKELCLLLLQRAVKAGEGIIHAPWASAAQGALAELLVSGAMGIVDVTAAVQHYEEFAEVTMAKDCPASSAYVLGLDVSSRYGATFGWENHGLLAHAALAKAAELEHRRQGAEAKARARQLWEAASECALEDPCLAKQAMHYMALAEAADVEEGTQGAEAERETLNEPEEVAIGVARQTCAMASGQAECVRRLRVEVVNSCGSPVEFAEVAVWDLDSNTRVSELVTTDSLGIARVVAPADKKMLVLRVLKARYIAHERRCIAPPKGTS